TLLGIQPDETEAPRFAVHDDDRRRAAQILAPAFHEPRLSGSDPSVQKLAPAFHEPRPSGSGPSLQKPLPHGRGSLSPTQDQYFAIHAGSGSYTVLARAKRWPPRHYAELIDALRTEFARPILLLEGPHESGVA